MRCLFHVQYWICCFTQHIGTMIVWAGGGGGDLKLPRLLPIRDLDIVTGLVTGPGTWAGAWHQCCPGEPTTYTGPAQPAPSQPPWASSWCSNTADSSNTPAPPARTTPRHPATASDCIICKSHIFILVPPPPSLQRQLQGVCECREGDCRGTPDTRYRQRWKYSARRTLPATSMQILTEPCSQFYHNGT